MSIPQANASRDASRLKRNLLVATLVIALVCVVFLGTMRILQDIGSKTIGGNTIGTWRLAVLLANAFFCIIVGCALRARGRRPPRANSFLPARR